MTQESPEGPEKISQIKIQNPNKTIVFATGCFNILQSGHVVFFEQLKQLGEIIVIGLGRDSTLKALKPSRPSSPEINRAYLLAAMEDVDYVVINNTNNTEIRNGKIDFGGVIEALKPHIFVLNDVEQFQKNEPYAIV